MCAHARLATCVRGQRRDGDGGGGDDDDDDDADADDGGGGSGGADQNGFARPLLVSTGGRLALPPAPAEEPALLLSPPAAGLTSPQALMRTSLATSPLLEPSCSRLRTTSVPLTTCGQAGRQRRNVRVPHHLVAVAVVGGGGGSITIIIKRAPT
jgi:hypothetical protein